MRKTGTLILALAASVAAAATALGWGAHGHRIITYAAIDQLPAAAPPWLREADVRHQIACQANAPDRWKGWPSTSLGHINKPDHYLDVELLDEFDLSLKTMPRLRGEYLKALVLAKHEHPERVSDYEPAKDPERTREWPGFLLHAIAERYAKLQSAFNEVRILETLDESRRAHQLRQARANAVYQMGMLAHLIGDLTQPLHTTRHFNGWVGDNPEGYTTDRGFHASIDSGWIEKHNLDYRHVRAACAGLRTLEDPRDPWKDLLVAFNDSFEQVERCYQLERDGQLAADVGAEWLTGRLAAASDLLATLYWSAYRSAAPKRQQIEAYVRYNEWPTDRKLPDAPDATASTEPSPKAAGR